MAAAKKLRPPIKRHGGKAYLARRIVALMPEHRVYVEPFIGGGSVLLNKRPADREIAGDLDAGLIRMWWSLQGENLAPFLGTLAEMNYDEATFNECESWAKSGFGPMRAVGFIVRNRFSRGGLGKTFAWSDRLRGGQPGDVNAWETIRAELPAIAERVANVEFHESEALPLIWSYDGPDTLHYCDPPYLHETRTARKAYEYEMSREDHVALLHTLMNVEGTFLLSGYRSELYDYAATLGNWHRVEWDLPNHSGQGATKQRRVECLWSNRAFRGGGN
jgi:DNA adenine methylase